MKNNKFPPTLIVGETYIIGIVGTSASATTPVKLGTYASGTVVTLP
jgi:hypothetical protein